MRRPPRAGVNLKTCAVVKKGCSLRICAHAASCTHRTTHILLFPARSRRIAQKENVERKGHVMKWNTPPNNWMEKNTHRRKLTIWWLLSPSAYYFRGMCALNDLSCRAAERHVCLYGNAVCLAVEQIKYFKICVCVFYDRNWVRTLHIWRGKICAYVNITHTDQSAIYKYAVFNFNLCYYIFHTIIWSLFYTNIIWIFR